MQKRPPIKITDEGVSPNGNSMIRTCAFFLFFYVKKIYTRKDLILFLLIMSFFIHYLITTKIDNILIRMGTTLAIIFFIFLFWFLNKKPK